MHKLPKDAGMSILFTFDDGPDQDLTPKILDRLKLHDTKAIFFVVGEKIGNSPKIFDRIVAEGHIIGNHTFSHPNKIITSATEYRKELLKCTEVIKNRTGKEPTLARPPLGMSYTNLKVAIAMQLKIVLWSIEGGEWGRYKASSDEEIAQRLKKELKKQDILLLHDNNAKTVHILDVILPFLHKRGYDLASGADYLLT